MTAQYIFNMNRLRKVHGTKEVLKDITLSFFPNAKIGVLGPNGAGKSTLLRIMAGEDKAFDGEASSASWATVGYVPQEPRLDEDKTVLENIREGASDVVALLKRYDEVNEAFGTCDDDKKMEKLLAEQARLLDEIEACDGWQLDRICELAIKAMHLPPADAEVKHLSGGEKRRVALARVLLQQPDMLLLDEPTNHLDAEAVAWLEKHLADYDGCIVAVTHDRYFLDNVAGWILELDRGKGLPFKGNYSGWLEQKEARLAQEEREENARQKTLKRELEWVRLSPKARQAKNKARVQSYDKLAAQAKESRQDTIELDLPPGPPLGGKVVEFKNVTKGFGERTLIKDLTFSLPRGGIVGVIGPNGAGKTTLFRMITGEQKPDVGSIEVGESVQLSYVDQSRDALTPDKLVYEEISEGQDPIKYGNREIPARAYAARFNFKGSDQQKRVGDLSGGERNRVHMAKMLKSGGNVLLLDEPSNDLDVDTLRALEEGLLEFPGCAVIISHDRWFLDRIATHILAFEGDGGVHFFDGNYSEYEEDRKRRLGDKASQPHEYRKKAAAKV
ncbi:MAG: energy-dependent translational throttle protein EttA [Proteobacteria bacterium]|nr:energy-dependent translational throttle protein EttA [Pseudomonadota bacterium]